MPTYEYECQRCGNVFEEFQSITDAPRKRCPKCRGKVQRLISAGAGIVFKGSGFYVTDSRKGHKSPPASTDGGLAKQDTESAGDKKTDRSQAEDKKTGDAKAADAKASDKKAPKDGSAAA